MPNPTEPSQLSDLAEGAKVGPYVVEGLLGRGGMGAVYRAHDARLLRTVALKVISLMPSSDQPREDFGARLLREARAAAAINHPNVVSVFDVGEEEDVFFMAMELVRGRTLRELVTSGAPWAEKLRWLCDTARALAALHEAGIIHRDVKPENVIVREDGVVKLLDLGIARRAVSSAVAPIDTVTGGGAIPGTPVYMSPEQLRGTDLAATTDQFSWAVLAFELLTGERPWVARANELYPVLLGIVNDPAPDIGERAPELPAVVCAAIMRALEKDPLARFASLLDVAETIEPFAAPSALPRNRDSGNSGKATPTVTPRPSMEPAAFAATTRAPATLSSPPKPKDDPPEPPRAPRASRRGLTITAGVIAAAAAIIALVPRTNQPQPVIATAHPLSSVVEADHDFTEAMQLFHDGATTKAEAKLEAALAADGTFALAHLEIALLTFGRDPRGAELHFQEAFQHRVNLDARGAALLEASEPYVRPTPDLAEWETRLLRAVKLHPKDSEALYYLGIARMKQLKFDDARTAFGNALRVAPDFIPAMDGLGDAERSMGHPSEALDVYRSCLGKSPFAVSCLEDEQNIYATSGECARAKTDAEAWVEMDPTSVRARLALADTLQATGTQYEGVKQALLHTVDVAAPPQKPLTAASMDISLALIQGRFDDAERAAKAGEEALPPSANRLTRASWVVRRALIALEIGDDAAAAELSKSFVARMDAYPKAPLDMDPDIDFYEPMYRARSIDRAKFDAFRRAWIQKELDTLRGTEVATQTARMPWLWVKAWAQAAETEDEAKEALALVSSFGQMIPEEQSPTRLNFTIGRVLALAGRSDEAISRLLHMTRACTELTEPQAWIRAHYYLGMAYEAKHDVPKARDAYGLVVERWGNAKTSVTAKAARDRMMKLGR